MPRAPREFFTVSSERKEGFPGKFPGFHEQFPAPFNPIIASLAASRPTPGGSWSLGNRPRTLVAVPNKGGWRGRGRYPSTSRTTGETGSRQENRIKSPFSRARRRGYVDTALAHPYILLFDPTATPVAFNGHWRLSQRVPPTMCIRRDRIVSTGFPGPNAPWKRPGWGAEGVVESRLVDFDRFVWFFFRLAWLRSVGQG
jgi:hypothetical protein